MNNFRCAVIACFLLSMCASGELIAQEATTVNLLRGEMEITGAENLSQLHVRRGDVLSIQFGGAALEGFVVTGVTRATSGNKVISASAGDGTQLTAVYSAEGEAQGAVRVADQYHRIFSKNGKLVTVSDDGTFLRERFDSGARVPPQNNILQPRELSRGAQRASRKIAEDSEQAGAYPEYLTGTAILDILIYYEEGFSEDPSVVADFLIAQTNTYFSNSKIDVRVNLVGLEPLAISADELQEDVLTKMGGGQAPFSNIEADRSFYAADVVFALRQNRPEGDDACGIAYVGVQDGQANRDFAVSSVHWKPLGTGQDRSFCSDSTFAHELGHVMGSLHERRLYEDDDYGAYRFSFGHFRTGLQGWHTIMSYGDEPEYPYFSNPDIRQCRSQPCGVAPGTSESADNATGFSNVAHMLASYESEGFAPDALSDIRVLRNCTTPQGDAGVERGHVLNNNSQYDIEVRQFTVLRLDGTRDVSPYAAGDFTIPSGRVAGLYECIADVDPNPFGKEIISSWFTYLEPVNRTAIEGPHMPWDASYEGSYSTVRIASSQGGSVEGHTARIVKATESVAFTFAPEPNYFLTDAVGTCEMRVEGTTVTVETPDFDCRVEPIFEKQVASDDTFEVTLEEPGAGAVYSGVGNLRGWAVASKDIEKVEIWIDGAYAFDAPYGAERTDVGDRFPEVEKATESGFSLAFNYNLLEPGEHNITARAYDLDGTTLDSSIKFSVTRFHKPFIRSGDTVDLSAAQCNVSDAQISLSNASIDGQVYNVLLDWRTAAQGFEIIEIR